MLYFQGLLLFLKSYFLSMIKELFPRTEHNFKPMSQLEQWLGHNTIGMIFSCNHTHIFFLWWLKKKGFFFNFNVSCKRRLWHVESFCNEFQRHIFFNSKIFFFNRCRWTSKFINRLVLLVMLPKPLKRCNSFIYMHNI